MQTEAELLSRLDKLLAEPLPQADPAEFVANVGGDQVGLGLRVPDKMPLTYSQYPPRRRLSLDEMKYLAKNTKIKAVEELYPEIYQQGNAPSCCPYATKAVNEAKRIFDNKGEVKLCAEWLWALINRGERTGTFLDDAMKASQLKGMAPEDANVDMYEKHTTDHLGMEQKRFMTQQAKMFRALSWTQCALGNPDETWHDVISNVMQRDPVLIAVHCGSNFFNCGSDGNYRPDRGKGNHAVAALGVDINSVLQCRSIRDIKLKVKNSHGKRWAAKGWYNHTFAHAEEPMTVHPHCACESMRTSEEEEIGKYLDF